MSGRIPDPAKGPTCETCRHLNTTARGTLKCAKERVIGTAKDCKDFRSSSSDEWKGAGNPDMLRNIAWKP